ncbi:hypothetical protein TNCV_1576511 [Trichonephila clavipes]|nr:hypothetical protein TNCV_1576511 [Trichonephila clavipes]
MAATNQPLATKRVECYYKATMYLLPKENEISFTVAHHLLMCGIPEIIRSDPLITSMIYAYTVTILRERDPVLVRRPSCSSLSRKL